MEHVWLLAAVWLLLALLAVLLANSLRTSTALSEIVAGTVAQLVFRAKWKESLAAGLVGFFGPFVGAALIAHYLLAWSWPASWLCGVGLSATSVAVVYAVMPELGLNRREFGKAILAACFVNDLGTVIALGLIFSPFTWKTAVFVASSVVVFGILPLLTPWFFGKFGGRVSELEAKYLLFLLFGMGGLAVYGRGPSFRFRRSSPLPSYSLRCSWPR